MNKILLITLTLLCTIAFGQQTEKQWKGKFEQLDELLPTPNSYRSATGGPGPKYWQQRADYTIEAEILEAQNVLKGKESITYYNNSPETLKYLWLQLDQNVNRKGNEDFGSYVGAIKDSMTTINAQMSQRVLDFEGGYTIKSVADKTGQPIPFKINNTMMRLDLASPLKPGESMILLVDWSYPITDRSQILLTREGYEYFPDDDNRVYLIAHWFPRMCVFDDYEGWQNKQFQRLGEFALEFGNYTVSITVPSDHIIGSTGVLQNPKDVLTAKELERMEKAKSSFDKPMMIVTEEEARLKEKTKATSTKTWRFQATNVRDFAFASSRKFIWDAQAVKLPTNTVMAMSFYPKEGLPVWSEESTKAIKNAIEVYSKFTFDYPYPVALSVNTSNIGMEFPMISFNGGRPKKGVMSDRAKAGMIGTIVHEVGHNYFPMIVSSDERQWMWMDEGLNTFLQTQTEKERYPQFPHTTPKDIVNYMKGSKNVMRPVMTTSDNERLNAFGANFYQKPTVALTILRETIMGPEAFDKAFKEYANRWMYKHPRPADLFRTMEESSAVDLDWFWRGWFYSTDNVDLTLDEVKWFKVKSTQVDPENKNPVVKSGDLASKTPKGKAVDFSAGPSDLTITNTPDRFYSDHSAKIDDEAVRKKMEGKNMYELTLKNAGGLVTPVVIEWTYKDGSKEIEKIPAEIWRNNEVEVRKVFVKDKEVTSIVLDPNLETADINVTDNAFPRKPTENKFDQIKKGN
jgi:hypothetical protein